MALYNPGIDTSGNGNNWTAVNISTAAGSTYDIMIDSPTNASASATQPVGNYCVLSPIDKNANVTLSNANLTSTASTLNVGGRASMAVTSGKWYYEVTVISTTNNQSMFGFEVASWALDYVGSNSLGFGWTVDGNKYGETGTTISGSLVSYTTNDVLAIALDMDAKQLTAYKNGTAIYVWQFTGTEWFPAYSHQNTTTFAFNFGQRPFAYSVPSGYKSWNTTNLPTSTITRGNQYMDATLYTGNSTTQIITNTAGFKPDFVWVKNRSGAYDHILVNSVTGANVNMYSNRTNAEVTNNVGGYVSSINSNGFTVTTGSTTSTDTNISGSNYVGWQWQAGQGSTSSNTSGSITSTVSVSTTAGFSVVSWTSDGSASIKTMGHGLGVSPAMVIAKRRDSTGGNWYVYNKNLSVPNDRFLKLNSTDAEQNPGKTLWSTSSTTFGIYQSDIAANGNTCIAYCFAEIAGFSKFGSYTGNGSTDGPFVYLGFRPRWIMFKVYSGATEDWWIFDTARNTYNAMNNVLFADLSNAEAAGSSPIDITANGFKIRTNATGMNLNSSSSYIYMAFAENPFKNSNAR